MHRIHRQIAIVLSAAAALLFALHPIVSYACTGAGSHCGG